MSRHKSPARKARRANFRATISRIQHDTGATRETAASMMRDVGASWRDFGLAYTGFGEPELGPPLPERMVKASTWKKDGIPVGRRRAD